MPVLKFRPRKMINSRVVKQLVPGGALSVAQRAFVIDAFRELSYALSRGLAGEPDDGTLSELFDAVGVVRDLSTAALGEPEHVGLCRLELAKRLPVG
jgi:hypothetical protein